MAICTDYDDAPELPENGPDPDMGDHLVICPDCGQLVWAAGPDVYRH